MLSDVRVLDLTDERGHLAGKILGDMGADVIKIEPPSGDPLRRRGPFAGGVVDPERSLPWLAMNTSKRSVTLDLRRDAARFVALCERSNVVLESAAPGHMDALGIGYQTLSKRSEKLVYCAITPFGQSGPYAAFRAHDLVVTAMGGNPQLTGDPDRPPVRCTLPSSYLHAAPEAALGIVMALYAERGGFVDISMHECQLQSLLSFPGQFAHGGRALSRMGHKMGRTREIWPAADGFITYGLRGGPARIPNLRATVAWMIEQDEAPEWLRQYDWSAFNHNTVSDADIARIEQAFGAFFASRSMRGLYREALARRILLAPCNNAREVLEQEQLRSRELFITLDYGDFTIEQPRFFARSSTHDMSIRLRAPRIGEHNAAVFGELAS